jgi:tRNA pseudouridine13 synthase
MKRNREEIESTSISTTDIDFQLQQNTANVQEMKKIKQSILIDNEVNFSPYSEQERRVGITEYISLNTVKPFFGILKHKFTDFLVNEVDMEGRVVQLTDISIPDDMKINGKELSKEEREVKERMGINTLKHKGLISEQKSNELIAFVNQYKEAEEKLLEKADKITADDIPFMLLDPESEKTKRTEVHEIIKKYFSHLLISDATASKECGSTCVRLRYNFTSEKLRNLLLNNVHNSRDGKKNKKKGRKNKKGGDNKNTSQDISLFDPRCNAWPKERPPYLQFVLYKENLDTTNAMSIIAKHIHLRPNVFTWAGTKDKRAVTTQLVTAFKVFPEKLIQINSVPNTGIQVGNFKFVKKRLLLGHLRGNRFNLVIRKVLQQDGKEGDEDIHKALVTIQQTGFINYFGMQRFGMQDNPTHRLGECVLKNDWETVVTKLLRSRCDSNQRLKEIIDQFFRDKDAHAALQKLSVTNSAIEKALISGYARSTVTDHSSAFGQLPKNLKTMFIHAYQSYVWNHMVSERIRKYGFKPVAGDLVLTDTSIDQEFDQSDSNIEDIEAEEVVGEDNTKTDASTMTSDTTTSLTSRKRGEPKVLLQEDLMNYTIYDVVMTIPGGSVIYPRHEINEDAYYQFMSNDNIEKVHFTRYQEEYGTFGAYRHIVTKAQDLNWKIVHHEKFDQKLLMTDLERLKNVQLEEPTPDKHRSLVIAFTLPSSTYATMFIRELTKLPSVRDGIDFERQEY